MTSAPVLALPEPHRTFFLHTDFCGDCLAAVLEQQQGDDKNHVIQFASKSCAPHQAKLGSTDGELLAVVWAIQKFQHYLAGQPFVLVTDNAALQYLETTKSTNSKLARYSMLLASYDFKIRHRAGKLHTNADGLSRARKPVH